jgi:hypothetical protein
MDVWAYSKKSEQIKGELRMRVSKHKRLQSVFFCFILLTLALSGEGFLGEKEDVSPLLSLLPQVEAWNFSEAPQDYFPQSLFEYINGAAEIYLAYDFQELIVGQYKRKSSEKSLSIEIYDMGNEKNSFGIYSAERFIDNTFIPIGNQGYLEEGTLNFIVGKYYIKLLCFDCEEEADAFLKLFSAEIVKGVKDEGNLPPILGFFPEEGLIQNSEKFFLRNFMGYSFLHNGYLADYRYKGLEFDCFLIEGESVEDAQTMLKQYLKAKKEQIAHKTSIGYRVKDRYYHNIYLMRVDNYICGVKKIKEGSEEVGERYMRKLIKSLKK